MRPGSLSVARESADEDQRKRRNAGSCLETLVMSQSKPRTVELVRSSYQPTKAEMEEEWEAPESLTLEQITKAVLQPVRIRWVGKPRSRRR